jgi:hypothetical protein
VKKSKVLMIVASLLLLTLFIFPLWKITLLAPQYPEPLGLNIHITHLSDGNQFNDVNNIDLLNHYIGMAHLPTEINVKKGVVEPFKEFTIFPIVIVIMTVFGVLFGFIGKRNLYLTWISILIILGVAGMYDFYLWLFHYGHNLNPNAILKITDIKTGEPMGYEPPFFGYKKLLNFEVYSYPAIGAYFIIVGMGIASLAYINDKRAARKSID